MCETDVSKSVVVVFFFFSIQQFDFAALSIERHLAVTIFLVFPHAVENM